MKYAALVDIYERLEATDSTLAKRDVLGEAFADADDEHLPLVVVLCQGHLFAAWQRKELGVSSSLTARAITKATGVSEDGIERRWEETGDLGDAAAWATENEAQRTLFSTDLTVQAVVETLRELPTYEGEGSEQRRVDAIAGLLSDATPREARYVTRTALGHLRIGIGEGLVRDAIALAFLNGIDDAGTVGDSGETTVGEATDDKTTEGEATNGKATDGEGADSEAIEAVERAFQVTNDYPLIAHTAREEGLSGLAELGIELFRPARVMLAEKAAGLDAGIGSVAENPADVLLEFKYDGARVQVHKQGEEVRVFTRRLEDVTDAFPDVVRAVRADVSATDCVLDGEVVGYDRETGDPIAFQQFSQRIKRKYDVEELIEEIPATLHCFDALSIDGESLLDASLDRRLDALGNVLDPEPGAVERATSQRVADSDAPVDFYDRALLAGHEGVMVKNLDAPYRPGRRVGYMMKAKPTMETLDLVVTRAQYSEGRRSDFLGRLFLACVDDTDRADDSDTNEADEAAGTTDDGRFREVGRLATGYTDEELRELTDRLEGLLTERSGRVFDVRPEVVLEIEYEEIQSSTKYDSGYALRFPRFLGVREDLSPADADTLSTVERLYDEQ